MSESTTTVAGRVRPARPQAVLAVVSRERLSPHTVRVTAGGPGFDTLRMNEFTDKYAKIIFVDPLLGLRPRDDLAVLRGAAPTARIGTSTGACGRGTSRRCRRSAPPWRLCPPMRAASRTSRRPTPA